MVNEVPLLDVRTSTRAEAVAHSIEQRITADALPTGHRLGTKDELRRQYDVAVATMSEAIRLLSARGAVTVRPGVKGGVFVATPTPLVRLGRKMLELSGQSVSVADCLVVRNALDPLIVMEATRHRSAADVRELRKIAESLTAGSLSMADYLAINWSLHRRMAQITPNEVLRYTYVSLFDFVQDRLQGVTAVQADQVDAQVSHGARVHLALVEAVASGDPAQAAAAAATHGALTSITEEGP